MEGLRRSKRAKLAVRRFLRQRKKQSEDDIAGKLAESNAAVFSEVAASIMGQDKQGKITEAGRMRAGVLCFDEININDPFTAIALKGKRRDFEACLCLPEAATCCHQPRLQRAGGGLYFAL